LVNDMSLLFGLADVRVERVVLLADGSRQVHVQTASEAAAGARCVGVISVSLKGNVATAPRDIPYGTTDPRWCGTSGGGAVEPLCAKASFTTCPNLQTPQ
jgi:hypothetical protein